MLHFKREKNGENFRFVDWPNKNNNRFHTNVMASFTFAFGFSLLFDEERQAFDDNLTYFIGDSYVRFKWQ